MRAASPTRSSLLLLLAALIPAPAAGQESGAVAACDAAAFQAAPLVPAQTLAQARNTCITVAQAVESAQPQLGILLAGGNPTLGTASTGGLRLGLLPRVSASARANVVFVRLPDILADEGNAAVQRLSDAVGIPVPALSGAVTVGVFPGVSLAPTVGGIGSVDLLASASWLPLETFDVEGFGEDAANLSYGFGARVGLLRESFTLPGVSVSVMRRSLGKVRYGEVCGSAVQPSVGRGDFEAGVCPTAGDPGEFAFDLTNWSTRAAVGKRLLGIGLTAGVGYDRFGSDVDFGFRRDSFFGRAHDVEVDSDRWSAFGNLSFTALVATLALEAGWMEGADPVSGFPPEASDYDPTRGTLFGSLGLRLAF